MLPPQIQVHVTVKGADTTHSGALKALELPCAASFYVL